MGIIQSVLANLPEVRGPLEKKLSFKQKLKWTLIVLCLFFILGAIPLFGLGQNALAQFEFLSIILAADFGSLISLGIGPIVTASIVLQLLSGSGLLKLDTTTHEGRTYFQGLQKILAIFFIIFEAIIYVYMGGLAPAATLAPSLYSLIQMVLVAQLFVGGMLIMYMDEVINKWGFGSGVSLFIAAGVSAQIIIRAFSPLTTAGTWAFGTGEAPVGKVWVLFQSLMGGNPMGAALALAAILATIIVFLLSVYGQAMKVEIPLSFGRVRGHGIRWPLNFIYTSNIPVILVAALMANVQLLATLLQGMTDKCRNLITEGATCSTSQSIFLTISNFFGTSFGGVPESGLVEWITSPNLVEKIITGSFQFIDLAHSGVFALFMVGGAVLFSIFWVQTAGMDAKSQARQIMSSGLQIPGFRRDPRVLEQILNRYIWPLTIMGAIAVGILASSADLMGALSRGTGILLAVMIIYKLYEEIAQQHMMDMYPALRKMMGGSN